MEHGAAEVITWYYNGNKGKRINENVKSITKDT